MELKNINIFFIALIAFIFSCNKEDLSWKLPRKNIYDGKIIDTFGLVVPNIDSPIVTTKYVGKINDSTTSILGNITSIGSSEIISYGHCWSENHLPTINDYNSIFSSLKQIGAFYSNLLNLNSNTTYYVRAFAINKYGISYGNEVNFSTSEKMAKLMELNDCSTLNNIISYSSLYNGDKTKWNITNYGYKGVGWKSSGNLGIHYVQIEHNFKNNGFIKFWFNTYKEGHYAYPTLYIDGKELKTSSMSDDKLSSSNWMQVQSTSIKKGIHVIKIEFNVNYYDIYLDELQFYEYL